MRRLGILLLALVAGTHAAHAQCIDVALLEPKEQVELSLRSFNGSKSTTKRRTIKRVNNFEFVATERSRDDVLESRFEENSILNLLPIWSDHSFFSNDNPQKKRVKTATIEKSYMYGHVNRVLEDMILKKKNFTINRQLQVHEIGKKNKKSTINEMIELVNYPLDAISGMSGLCFSQPQQISGVLYPKHQCAIRVRSGSTRS